jgi:hypothetical protein
MHYHEWGEIRNRNGYISIREIAGGANQIETISYNSAP